MKIRDLFLLSCMTYTLTVGLQPDTMTSKSRFYKEMILEAANTTGENGDVTVVSELPGNISWLVTNDSVLTIELTVVAEDIEDIQFIKFDFRSEYRQVSLYIRELVLDNISSAVIGKANRFGNNVPFSYLIFMVVVTTAFFNNWKGFTIILVFTILNGAMYGLVSCVEERMTQRKTVNVLIKGPRNMTFREVYLRTKDGDVTLPYDVHADVLQCSTLDGYGTGCDGCCHGNGVCRRNACTCYPGYDTNTACSQRTREDILFIHFRDPRLTQTTLPSGDVIDVYGNRRSNGSVTEVTQLHLNTSNGDSFKIFPDQTFGIQRVEDTEGLVMSVMNGSNCSVLVNFPARNPTAENSSRANEYLCMNMSTVKHKSVLQDTLNMNVKKKSRYLPGKRFKNVSIHVRRCADSNTEADVIVEVEPIRAIDTKHAKFEIKANRRKNNHDVFFLRLPNVKMKHTEHTVERECAEVTHLLYKMCTNAMLLVNQLCNTSLLNTKKSCTATQKSCTLCSNVKDALTMFCDKYTVPMIQPGSKCLPTFARTVDIFMYDSFYLRPKAVLTDGRTLQGSTREITLYTPVAKSESLFIDDDRPEFKVKSITVHPEDPVPKNVYQVRLEYECATTSTVIKMNVTGSDQYRNHVTCVGVNECKCCTIHAAGASDAIVDTVKINITDSLTNYNYYKEVVIVF